MVATTAKSSTTTSSKLSGRLRSEGAAPRWPPPSPPRWSAPPGFPWPSATELGALEAEQGVGALLTGAEPELASREQGEDHDHGHQAAHHRHRFLHRSVPLEDGGHAHRVSAPLEEPAGD